MSLLAGLCWLGLWLFGAFSSPVSPAYDAEEIAFVEALNRYRVEVGVQPVELSETLTLAAERHNHDMSTYDFLSHATEESEWFEPGDMPWDRACDCGYGKALAGEVIVAGVSDPLAALEALKASGPHQEVMVCAELVMVGLARDYFEGSSWSWYWTVDFGGNTDERSKQ